MAILNVGIIFKMSLRGILEREYMIPLNMFEHYNIHNSNKFGHPALIQ